MNIYAGERPDWLDAPFKRLVNMGEFLYGCLPDKGAFVEYSHRGRFFWDGDWDAVKSLQELKDAWTDAMKWELPSVGKIYWRMRPEILTLGDGSGEGWAVYARFLVE